MDFLILDIKIQTMRFLLFSSLCLFLIDHTNAQKTKLDFGIYEGTIIIGYVDDGGYLNFTGPGISAKYGNSKFLFGLMPSLRFKEDKGTPKNAFFTPSLGLGLTYSYKALALQVPLYYRQKTASVKGQWLVGLGVGLKLDRLKKK